MKKYNDVYFLGARRLRSIVPQRRRSKAAVLCDDVSMYTSLICRNVPLELNNSIALKKHFGKYGDVSRVFTNPNKNSATIKFIDHVSFLNSVSTNSTIFNLVNYITSIEKVNFFCKNKVHPLKMCPCRHFSTTNYYK